MISDKYLYIIGGPTASGKTAKAIEMAQSLKTVILSADSRQFYKEMTIGTAKPSISELDLVKHYFIDNLSINEEYDAGTYENEAINLLDELFKIHDIVIMAGGSGLFIKAVTDGLDFFPTIYPEIREQTRKLMEEHGIEKLQEFVSERDPKYFKSVDIQNPRRLLRAAEVILQTGSTFSSFRKSEPKKRNFSIIKNFIEIERETLYERINIRVDEMVKRGLKDEAMELYPYKDKNPLQTVGYKEWFDYFEGKITHEQAVELIKQNSRRYAKRQVTWFKNDGGWLSNPPSFI